MIEVSLPRTLHHPSLEDSEPAEGLRSSADCPVRRIRQYVDKSLYVPFNLGVAEAGHAIEQRFIEYVLRPSCEVMVPDVPTVTFDPVMTFHYDQFEIAWDYGVSHVDAVVFDGPFRGCWEVKSGTCKGEALIPTRQNVRQVQRMMVLADRSGVAMPGSWRIVCVGKDGNDSHRMFGPYLVSLNDREAADIHAEFDATCTLMDRIETIDLHDPAWFLPLECRCGSCFPKPKTQASIALERLLDEYQGLDSAVKEGDKTAKAPLAKLRERIKAQVIAEGASECHQTTDYDCSITKAGHLMIRPRRDSQVAA